MNHVVLLGDSIFDNGVYVPGEPDVAAQLGAMLPDDWRTTMLAVDGAVASDVASQLELLPGDATHLVLSAGGNDALGASWLLGQSVANVGEAVLTLAGASERFAGIYSELLDLLSATGLPTAVCTIYDTPPSAPDQRVIRTALSVFNDVITRAAFGSGMSLIDLRLICGEDDDYANPIEPSAQGGAKISAAIARFATGRAQAARVYV